MDQQELWRKVNAIKRHVRDQIGTELSHEFRSSTTYQGYTGLCGEAQMAYEEGALNEELIALLETYAHKVIALCQEKVSSPDTSSPNIPSDFIPCQ
jgi:hypothetical protein